MNGKANRFRVAVVGSGAVGGYFGGMMARAGLPVVLIGRPALVEAVRKEGLLLDTAQFRERIAVDASTEMKAAQDTDFVLFCVKTTDTIATARELAKYVGGSTIVVSLQNGVNNVEQIRESSGIEALGSVVYVAAAMPAPGHIRHLGRGDLVVGPENEKTKRVAELCSRGNVPCRISENIEGELWVKLVWNCALNAISGLGRATYGEIIASEDAKRVVRDTVHEVLAVAKARNITLPGLEDPEAALRGAFALAGQMSGTRSSTAQDMARGKKTEIDALNGYIAKEGERVGVPVPVNHALYALVKLWEQSIS